MPHLDLQIQDGISPHLQKTLAELQNTRPLMQKIVLSQFRLAAGEIRKRRKAGISSAA